MFAFELHDQESSSRKMLETTNLQRRIKSDESDTRWVDSCYLNFIMFVDNDLILMMISWFISMLFMLVWIEFDAIFRISRFRFICFFVIVVLFDWIRYLIALVESIRVIWISSCSLITSWFSWWHRDLSQCHSCSFELSLTQSFECHVFDSFVFSSLLHCTVWFVV